MILPDGKRAAVGYSDGSMRIFDLKTSDVLHNLTTVFSDKAAVCAMDARSDNQLVAVGSSEGEITIVNSQSGKILATVSCKGRTTSGASKPETSGPSIESLAFTTPEVNQIVSADIDGNLKVWDLSSQVCYLFFIDDLARLLTTYFLERLKR